MTRRCLVWLLIGFLIVTTGIGTHGCKEERESSLSHDENVQPERAISETESSKTTVIPKDTLEFEEQEGVQQESPPQYDY